jgi:hypothetical protein
MAQCSRRRSPGGNPPGSVCLRRGPPGEDGVERGLE